MILRMLAKEKVMEASILTALQLMFTLAVQRWQGMFCEMEIGLITGEYIYIFFFFYDRRI